jgi:hypothetical protein
MTSSKGYAAGWLSAVVRGADGVSSKSQRIL